MKLYEIGSYFLLFIKNMGTSGYTYLNGITAAIAAFIPLTTIIFAQYYDKSAERANEHLWDIKEEINKNIPNYQNIKMSLKKMIYVGSNSSFFNFAIIIFSTVSYGLLILWGLAGYGYLLNTKDPLSLTDRFTVVSSTLLFIGILFFLPILFYIMKKRVPIVIKNNGCPLIEFKKVFEISSNYSCSKYFREVHGLKLTVPILSNHLELNLEQEVPLSMYHILFNINVDSQRYIILKLDLKQGKSKYKFKIKQPVIRRMLGRHINYNPTSVFDLLQNANKSLSKAFIRPNRKKSYDSCQVNIDWADDKVTNMFSDFEVSSLDAENKLIYGKGSFIKVVSNNNEINYKLKESLK
jgi:hypothetical protein